MKINNNDYNNKGKKIENDSHGSPDKRASSNLLVDRQ